MRGILAVLLVAFGALAFAPEAAAHPRAMVCYDKAASLYAELKEKYNEVPVMNGRNTAGIVRLHLAPTGSWTFTLEFPNGQACLIESGFKWGVIEEAPPVVEDVEEEPA